MSLFSAGILGLLFKMVEPLQMLMHFPIFMVKIPAIVMIVFSAFVPIVNFDFLVELEFYSNFLKYLSFDNSINDTKQDGRVLQQTKSSDEK